MAVMIKSKTILNITFLYTLINIINIEFFNTMTTSLISFLKKQSFQPGFFSVLINPFFLIRRSLFKGIKQNAPQLTGRLMDFGCGRKPYENLFQVNEYIGVDVKTSGHDHASSKVDVFYNGKTLPFADNSFDSVFCAEAIEHIFNPDEVLLEIKRVMKNGGRILLTAPFCWNEHEIPFDYARYSSFGISHLLEKQGFKIITLHKSGNFMRTIFQMTALYFFELFKKKGKAGYVLSLIFTAPINIIASLLLPLFPKNNSLYFNNIIVAEKET